MTTNLGGYDMDGVMLDLGFDVNILPKNSWELMGNQIYYGHLFSCGW
jgi:hypothetical protein